MAYAAVNSKQLLTAVKTVQGVITDRDPSIYVTFVKGQMELMGEGKERGTGKTVVAADCRGRGTFKIDPTFLSSMLATLDNTTITIGCNGGEPLLIETAGEEFTYVVMPSNGEKDAPSPNQSWEETDARQEQEWNAYWKERAEREHQSYGRVPMANRNT